VIATEQTFA